MHRMASRAERALPAPSLALLAFALAACGDRPAPVAPPSVPAARPSAAEATGASPASQAYIVTLAASVRDVPGEARRLAVASGAAPDYVYERVMRGFAVRLPAQAAAALAHAPGVLSVRAAVPMQLSGLQSNPPWGLDRIDQTDLPLNDSYSYGGTGAGYTAYIFDTGIRTTHLDFEGRASTGWTYPDGLGGIDCHGHGTHVAGTVGSATYGVAKKVQLVAIRVFGTLACSGSDAELLAAIDWLLLNRRLPAVANMSLGFGQIVPEVDAAVQQLVASGVAVVVAAGNSGVDACTQSPSSVPEAVTVAASDDQDRRSNWFPSGSSNFGPCVDIFAPGTNVLSTSAAGNTASTVMSGTSMASPHVAGAVAYTQAPLSSDGVARVLAGATQNRLTSIGTGSPNRLLNTNVTVDCGINGCAPPPPSDPRFANVAIGGPYSGVEGGSVSFAITGTPDPTLTYSWDFGDLATASGPSATHTYLDSDDYLVSLTARDAVDPTIYVTRTTTVTVANVPPTVNAGPDVTIVAGTSFSVQASFTDPSPNDGFWTYTVDWGDGTTPFTSLKATTGAVSALPHTYTSVGSYQIRVTVADKDGGSASDIAVATVVPNQPPVARANGPYTGKEGTGIAFSSAGTSDPEGQSITYAWSFGDGTTSTLANPSKIYTDDGTFTVTLTVKDKLGATGTSSTTATIANVAPTLTMSAPTIINEGATYLLSLTGNDAGAADRPTLEYALDCGQGAGLTPWSRTVKSATCPALPNQDTLTLEGRVRDDEGATTAVVRQLIVRNAAPVATLIATSATTVAPGATVSFEARITDAGSLDAPWTYTMVWGDGTASATGSTSTLGLPIPLSHQYNKPGTWYASITAKDRDGANGMSARITISVSNSPPVANANGPYSGVEGKPIVFSSAGSNDPDGLALSYKWTFGDGTTSVAANPSKTYADNGSYAVTLTVTDPSGAKATASTTASVTNAAPTATLSAPTSTSEGNTYLMSLTGTDPGTADRPTLEYAFDCGQGAGWTPWSTTIKSITCPAKADQGSVGVGGRIRDKDGGTNQYARTVNVTNAAPVVQLAATSATSFRVGGTLDVQVTFADKGALDAPWSYTISWGDGASSTGTVGAQGPFAVSHVYSRAGTWPVLAFVKDKDNSTGSSNRVTATVSP